MYFVGGPLMYKNPTSYTLIGTLSSVGLLGCGNNDGGNYNEISDWVDCIKKEMVQLGENADGKSCKNGGHGLGNPDDGGGDNGLDNQDQNGGDSVDNPD